VTFARVAELARCRAAQGLDEAQCFVWLGVGLATLERIEAGEVEPTEEVVQRIDRFLSFAGGTASLPASSRGLPFSRGLPGSLSAHGGDPEGGGAAATGPAAQFGARS
jgi:hypothetical protein